MNSVECEFCNISHDVTEAHVVFKNKEIIAFLDINPASPGHILVAPIDHYATVFDTPLTIWSKIMNVVYIISTTLHTVLGAEFGQNNILVSSGTQAGQEIDHLHVHIIPRKSEDHTSIRFHYTTDECARQDLGSIAKKIKDALAVISQ